MGDSEPIGGQALLEGVMMRRGASWGAAVRHEDGSLATIHRDLPPRLARWRRYPFARGVLAIGETASLGTRAMMWAAAERGPGKPAGTDGGAPAAGPRAGYSRTGLAASTVTAVVLAAGVFGLLPGALVKAAGVDSSWGFSAAEGAVRLVLLVGYLGLLSLSPRVRRVFSYHGAEHMTIHAFEHHQPLRPDTIRAFDQRHPRCGTSFLLLVVAVTVVTHMVIGSPSWPVLVASRIIGLPVVAGLTYELIRLAGRRSSSWYGRALAAPGFWLQGLTTRRPDDEQIEVAVAALQATVADPALARSVDVEPGARAVPA